MRLVVPIVGLVAIILAPAVTSQTSADSKTTLDLCEVMNSPSRFDHRNVVVSGVAGNSSHHVDFWKPECGRHGANIHTRFADGYRLGQPSDKSYFRLLRKEGAVGVTFEGTFESTGGPFGSEGARFELVISSVAEVSKLSKDYRQKFDIGTGKF